jgi:FtsP/CotA-like multicopper oxidase with cupredoxin domain
MIRTVTPPITPFVDPLPLPSRLIAVAHDGRLTVRLRAGRHRFHRDLPASEIWGFDGTVPGPTIEAERGQPVTVMWQNELDGAFPVTVMTMKSQKPSDARHSNAGVAAGAACH